MVGQLLVILAGCFSSPCTAGPARSHRRARGGGAAFSACGAAAERRQRKGRLWALSAEHPAATRGDGSGHGGGSLGLDDSPWNNLQWLLNSFPSNGAHHEAGEWW